MNVAPSCSLDLPIIGQVNEVVAKSASLRVPVKPGQDLFQILRVTFRLSHVPHIFLRESSQLYQVLTPPADEHAHRD